MLIHSCRKGQNDKSHTQYATVRKNRSAFSNLFEVSKDGFENYSALAIESEAKFKLTKCPTNSFWFTRWNKGCQARMGFVERKNKAISFELMMALMKNFKKEIKESEQKSPDRRKLIAGMVYSVLSFCGAFRGSETLKLDWKTLLKFIDKGAIAEDMGLDGRKVKSAMEVPHVTIPLRGRFKGEQGERCHLIPMANITKTGIPIRKCVELFIISRKELGSLECNWAFVSENGSKMEFSDMNEIIWESIEAVKEADERDKLGLREVEVRDEFSINRSFRRGATTHARNQKIPADVIEAYSRWRKVEASRGRKPRLDMIEEYSDIALLIPMLVQYTEML